MDRFGRIKEMIKEELSWMNEKGVRPKIFDIPTTLMYLPEENVWVIKVVNNILIEVLGSIAEEERIKINQRQKEESLQNYLRISLTFIIGEKKVVLLLLNLLNY